MSDSDSTVFSDEPAKKCAKCKEVKPADKFGKVKGKIRSYCRICHSAANLIPDNRLEKKCPCCQLVKLVTEFNRLGNRYQPACRECQNYRMRALHAERKQTGENIKINRDDYWRRRRWIKLRAKYGVSQQQYEKMALAQSNLCAICLATSASADSRKASTIFRELLTI